ncbi:MAG: molybdopterin cofactor-binding domain-containing protein, partial [Chitinophagales bacterium]
MKSKTSIPRRTFIRLSALSGASLFAIGFLQSDGKEPEIVNLSGEDALGTRMNAYIFIDVLGLVTIFNHRPEMGQGTFESIPMIIAEELEVDINAVNIMASPANRSLYGSQMVVGSQSIRSNYELMRKIGASARETLVNAAASRWNVPAEECYAKKATVIHRPTGRNIKYGELAEDASKMAPPQNPKLKDPKDFTIIGSSPARKDIPSKTNGQAIYGIDCKVNGMLYASIERSPVFLGRLIGFDDTKTKEVKGVKFVLKTQRNVWGHVREGVAVVADSYWAAEQGRKALKIQWDNGDLESWSSEKIRADFRTASAQEGASFKVSGDFKSAFDNAAIK